MFCLVSPGPRLERYRTPGGWEANLCGRAIGSSKSSEARNHSLEEVTARKGTY